MATTIKPKGRSWLGPKEAFTIDVFHLGVRNSRFPLFHPFPIDDCMTDDTYEYRYEQRDDEYALRCWHNGTQRFYREFTYNMPGWLRAILDTAKVAGAMPKIKEPPPDVILWFRTDPNHNLIEFIEMK